MPDFLDKLAGDAKERIESHYYAVNATTPKLPFRSHVSLKEAIIKNRKASIITEIKTASPSRGKIRTNLDVGKTAKKMQNGGAVGISVLTEPENFCGSMEALLETCLNVKIPILMKDIILSSRQLEAASMNGADTILLILDLFRRGHCECEIEEMIKNAQKRNLEVLLETHTENEFRFAVESKADLVGINNRNLGTLQVDLGLTENILESCETKGKIVVSESGISTPTDIRFLRKCGADAFLVGSAVMLTDDVEKKVKELMTGF